jgi:hypothetical protein
VHGCGAVINVSSLRGTSRVLGIALLAVAAVLGSLFWWSPWRSPQPALRVMSGDGYQLAVPQSWPLPPLLQRHHGLDLLVAAIGPSDSNRLPRGKVVLLRGRLPPAASVSSETTLMVTVSALSRFAWHVDNQRAWQVDGAQTAELVEATYTAGRGMNPMHEFDVLATQAGNVVYRLTVDWTDGLLSRDDALAMVRSLHLRPIASAEISPPG